MEQAESESNRADASGWTSQQHEAIALYPAALYPDGAPGSERWSQQEKQYHSALFDTEVVANVVVPTLIPFIPADPNGTALIVAPGGGFHVLSINSEGLEVARWLAERGFTAFVLKYRLVETGDDGPTEMFDRLNTDRTRSEAETAAVAAMAGGDAEVAVKAVRDRAKLFGIAPDRVGFIGFSAGGNVAARVAATTDVEARPNFVAPIYASLRDFELGEPPPDSGPLFVVAASDDQLGLVPDSISLYQAWLTAGLEAELHVYQQGGHGFGLRQQGLVTDSWIERFGDWLDANGFSAPDTRSEI